MKNRSTLFLLLVLSPMIFVFAFALDIYIPVVPQMMNILHTTQGKVQITLTIYMMTIGLGQLIFGPLADQIGRKKIAVTGSILFVTGSILCAVATSINFLIFARFIQGAGACASFVCAFAIVRDLFEGVKAGQMLSYLTACVSASPIIAPALGAYLDHWLGWRAIFFALVLIGCLGLILVCYGIEETLALSKRKAFTWRIFQRYFEIIKNKNFLVYDLSATASMIIFFTWFTSSSLIVITLLHVPEITYGYYFGLMGSAFLLGNFLAGRIVPYFGIYKTVLLGASLGVLAGIIMLANNLFFGLTLAGYFIPMGIYCVAGALTLGSSAAGALEPMGEIAGSASAVLGFSEFFLASLVPTIILHWKLQSTFPLGFVMTIASGIILMLLIRHKRYLIYQAPGDI